MIRRALTLGGSLVIVGAPVAAHAQDEPPTARSTENAVRQAADAFGISVGREELGLYGSADVRGFSPIDAGNARIDGLYFDPVSSPTTRISSATTILVGLAAQGYPFPAPTGIVDFALRKPEGGASLSTLVSADGYGGVSAEFDAALLLSGPKLILGIGGDVTHSEESDGTDGTSYGQAVYLRWRPLATLEVQPFWQRSQDAGYEIGPIYIPAGATLPPKVRQRRFDGPAWAAYGGVGGLYGVSATAAPAASLQIRLGLFHSYFSQRTSAANLLLDVTPDGFADRLVLSDPPSRSTSDSGELRATRTFSDGRWTHLVHLSLRGRDRRQSYGGSAVTDLGRRQIGVAVRDSRPDLVFGAQSRDRVRQATPGIAYEGRRDHIGEFGIGIQKAFYSKRSDDPATGAITSRSRPWLVSATAALHPTAATAIYGSYTRGLEETGAAPDNAINRGQPVPAIETRQVDGGVRWSITPGMKLIVGAFDLTKPYYSLDAANRFVALGLIRNQGIETSLAGAATSRLNIVAGAVLLRPRVLGSESQAGTVGKRPVGIANRSVTLNADWRPHILDGLSFDLAITHRGSLTATTDNLVMLPARTLVDLGGRYQFKLGANAATLRVAVSNIGNVRGFDLGGAGAYSAAQGRLASAYLTVDY